MFVGNQTQESSSIPKVKRSNGQPECFLRRPESSALVGGGFAASYLVGLSAMNMAGRMGWGGVSDYLGRKQTCEHIQCYCTKPLLFFCSVFGVPLCFSSVCFAVGVLFWVVRFLFFCVVPVCPLVFFCALSCFLCRSGLFRVCFVFR